MDVRMPWDAHARADVIGRAGRRRAAPTARFTARRHGHALWLALWGAAIAAEALALRPLVLASDAPVAGLDVLFALTGGSFAACGLVAWRRRPDSRSGALMTATGFAFFLPQILGQIDGAVATTAGFMLVDAWFFSFVALILTLLTAGRLRPGLDRWLVALYALPLVLLQVVWLLFAELDGNLLLAFADEQIAHVLDRTQRGMLAAASVATVIVIGVRWWRASGPRRRALLPSVAGAFGLSCVAALLISDLVTGTRTSALLWLAVCSLLAVPVAFLVGLLRSRLARSGLAELFVGLSAMRGRDLQAALAKTLGDPDLVVGYWLPDYQRHADADGNALVLPDAGGDRRVASIERDGGRVAVLMYDAALDDDPELVDAVSAAAGIAIEHAHLHAEAQARLADLKASRERIVAAGDAERRRLERDLHDGAQQRLVGIALQLRLLQNRLGDDPSAEQLVARAGEELARSLAELRELARGIHPAVLEHGLAAALDALASRSAIPTSVRFEPPGPIPRPVELAAYFVACEALANAAKYSGATHATVSVRRADAVMRIEIADDGVGGADDARGTGLRGLADRVEALDGRLWVHSPSGRGTTVSAELPCATTG